MKIFLCGDTGRLNRGCEAIVRSSVKVLNKKEIYLATCAPNQNLPMVHELGISMIPYDNYPTKIHRYACGLIRKLFKKSVAGFGMIQKSLFRKMTKDDLSLNIGGDTYCYERPATSLALNNYTHKKGIKNILWCCSIEKAKIKGQIKKDLEKYELIFAREQITVNNLLEGGIPNEKIVKVCDPAFFLDKKEVELPKGFLIGNTVGINLSDCVVYGKYTEAYENIKVLIDWILKETDMAICLVPHVYSVNDLAYHDFPILKRLYEEYDNPRITLVDKEYDCEQLKYIISNCRFFIGARTHSTIAAYSSGIPTLVIGYSVKSKGIATDLFGKYEGYVFPFDGIHESDVILKAFQDLMENEEYLKELYKKVLPSYKKQLTDAIEKYIISNDSGEIKDICDKEQCTGCGACSLICPNKCITMAPDKDGFQCPSIDKSKCVNCGKCKRFCPVVNKPKDDLAEPKAFAAINKSEEQRMKSSSGGMFSVIASNVLNNGGVVCAPAFDENFVLKHIFVDDIKKLPLVIGSKYIQSDVDGVYPKIESFLNEGRRVLFSGTPCQVGGLKAYLRKEYDNLILQDIICHGVSSPKAWDNYLNYKKARIKIDGIDSIVFRQKMQDGNSAILINFSEGQSYCQNYQSDSYIKSYLSNGNIRKSCCDCSFKQVHRQSDITLADFWGIETVAPEMDDKKGVSLVLVHSKKGLELLDFVGDYLQLKEVEYIEAVRANQSYTNSTKKNPCSEAFFKKLNNKNFDKKVNKYFGNGRISKIRRTFHKSFN